MVKQIAEQEQIPVHFLAKILQELTKKGFLRSNKGPSGGFSLRVPAQQIRLIDLVEALDGPALAEAAHRVPWMLDSWKDLHSRIMNYLGRNTIADLASAIQRSRLDQEKSRRTRRSVPKKS